MYWILWRPSFIKYRVTYRLNNFLLVIYALPSPVVDLVHLEPSLPSRSNKMSFCTWMVDQMDFLPEVRLWLLKVPGPEKEKRFRNGFNIWVVTTVQLPIMEITAVYKNCDTVELSLMAIEVFLFMSQLKVM